MGLTAKGTCAKIASAKIGTQQILAIKARVKRKLNVVVEGDIFIDIFYGRPPATIDCVRRRIVCISRVGNAANDKRRQTRKLGGGKLLGLQGVHPGLEAVDAALQHGEFFLNASINRCSPSVISVTRSRQALSRAAASKRVTAWPPL